MAKYLCFHNAANTTYMNTVDNLRSVTTDTETITFNFAGPDDSNGASNDQIICELTAGKEETVAQFVGRLLSNTRDAVTVIADDNSSVYAHANIEAVTSITEAGTARYMVVEAKTATYALLAGDSGKTIFCNPGATTNFTLPAVATAGAGWNIKIIASEGIDATATGMDNIINIHAGSGNDDFIGIILDSNDGVGDYAVSGDDYVNITDSAGPGSRIDIICDGSRYYVYGMTNEQAQCLFNSAAAA